MLGVATATIFAYFTVLDVLANQAENAHSAPPSPLNSTSTTNSTNAPNNESTEDSGVFNLTWYWYTILVAGLIAGLLPISIQIYIFFKYVIPRPIHKRIEAQGFSSRQNKFFNDHHDLKSFVKQEFEHR
jgi:hypothetical protein